MKLIKLDPLFVQVVCRKSPIIVQPDTYEPTYVELELLKSGIHCKGARPLRECARQN